MNARNWLVTLYHHTPKSYLITTKSQDTTCDFKLSDCFVFMLKPKTLLVNTNNFINFKWMNKNRIRIKHRIYIYIYWLFYYNTSLYLFCITCYLIYSWRSRVEAIKLHVSCHLHDFHHISFFRKPQGYSFLAYEKSRG